MPALLAWRGHSAGLNVLVFDNRCFGAVAGFEAASGSARDWFTRHLTR